MTGLVRPGIKMGFGVCEKFENFVIAIFSLLQPCSHLRGAKFFVDVFDKHTQSGVKYYLLYPWALTATTSAFLKLN